MTTKTIGFRRNIRLAWLDATAAICLETDDEQQIRAYLDGIVDVPSAENRRAAIGILLNIWRNTRVQHLGLHKEAQSLFKEHHAAPDRVWLHYGLTLLAYPFFRLTAATLGQQLRYADAVTPKELKKRMISSVGQLGGLDKAIDRIVFALRDWKLLTTTAQRFVYTSPQPCLATPDPALERWLLETALAVHPAQELAFADLVRLPELFAFQFTTGIEQLRHTARFEVHRQGSGWDMVRLTARELHAIV